MCRRRYKSHPHPIRHLISEFTSASTTQHTNPYYSNSKATHHPRRRHGCYSHKYTSYPTSSSHPINNTLSTHQPRTTMAGLLLAGLSIGATKIQEKREKKKAQKALLDSATASASTSSKQTGIAASGSSRSIRKSEEARREEGERRGSTEEDEVPPPSYDEVVQGDGMRYGNGGGVRSEGGRARRK